MSKQIKKEELDTLQKIVTTIQTLQSQIGKVETQKHILLHQYDAVGQKLNEFKLKLKEAYGDIDIDFKTGEYTKIKNNESDKKD
tara:strand:+ start:249 stop:500 length:252 start_codon:yes stop_codon:yes gene_type:complete